MDFIENFYNWKTLHSKFLRYTDLQPAVFPLPPQLFQVKGQSEKKKFGSYICPAASQEAPESEILLEKGKGALRLDGAAQAQTDPSVCGNGGVSPCAFLPKSLVQYELLRPVYILNAAALCPAGTAGAVFTAIPGAGNQLPIFPFTVLPAQRQPASLGTQNDTARLDSRSLSRR